MTQFVQSFGEKIVFNRLSSVEMPVTKAELIEKYGDEPVDIDRHTERVILLGDILRVNTVEIFHSRFELAMELNKIYRRVRRGLF